MIGLAFHVAAVAFLVLARKEFWAKVRRGALVKAAAALVAGMAIGILVGWGLLELFPGTLERDYRLAYAVNRVVAFAGVGSDAFEGQHPHVFVNALLGLFGALALMVAAIVLFRSQRCRERADRRGRIGHPRAAGAVRQERLPRLLRHPAGQGRGVRAQRPRGHHLPRRGRRVPGQRRPGRRSEGVAAGDRGVAAAVPGVRLGAGRDGRQFGCGRGVPRGRTQRAAARRRGDPASRRLPAVGPRHARRAAGGDAGAARRADGADPAAPRHLRRRDGRGDQAGRRLARHRDRARLLDGAGPARRSRRRRLPAGRGGAGPGERRRDAVAGAVGHQRGVAGPDAPLAAIAQRHHRTDGDRAVPAVGRHWGQPYFAELRDVPVGVRAGRAARRRPGRPAVARPAGVLLPLVAAGDAVPVEHEVPARVGAALRLLRGRPAGPAGRRRVGHRRRLPGAAVLAAQRAAAHRTSHRGAGESGRDGSAASRRQRARPDRAAGRPARERRRAATARAGARPDGQTQGPAGQRRRRLPGRAGAQPHRRAGDRSHRRRGRDGGRARAADPRLRRRAVRAAARLVR